MSSSGDSGRKVLATNRKARRNYTILENVEAGIELVGTEVKSIRANQFSLDEAFADVDANNQAYLQNLHIMPYSHGNRNNHEPVRPRRLLLKKAEIIRIAGKISTKGLTLVALDIHLRRGRIKVELGLAKGKNLVDKRDDLKKRTADRETARAISDARKR